MTDVPRHGPDPCCVSGRDPDPAPELRLTRAEASVFLQARGIRMKPATLARAYSTGSGGPPCRHIRNKPYYPLDLLEAWAETQIGVVTTSSGERQRLRREARRKGREGPAPSRSDPRAANGPAVPPSDGPVTSPAPRHGA